MRPACKIIYCTYVGAHRIIPLSNCYIAGDIRATVAKRWPWFRVQLAVIGSIGSWRGPTAFQTLGVPLPLGFGNLAMPLIGTLPSFYAVHFFSLIPLLAKSRSSGCGGHPLLWPPAPWRLDNLQAASGLVRKVVGPSTQFPASYHKFLSIRSLHRSQH